MESSTIYLCTIIYYKSIAKLVQRQLHPYKILMKDGTVRDISDFSELLHSEMVDRRSERHYIFVQREK